MVNGHENLKYLPSVFAVENEYQIFSVFDSAAIVKVRVGDEEFYDDSCGILRSNINIHRVAVPMSVLDAAEEYTLIYRKIIERTPYFPTSEEEKCLTIKFRPVKGTHLNIYLMSDTHNLVDEPIACGTYFGRDIDLLVLNGDIPNHSGDIENFNSIYEIAAAITGGECPSIFARGNHDTRGIHAEELTAFSPNANGKTYYTFRIGSVWGLVLDCGEDKNDDHPEYGGTTCFHNFRLGETRFLREVAEKGEYNADGIEYKLIICHMPFTYRSPQEVFAIEQDIYSEWASLLRERIKPNLMLCGHLHTLDISPVGGERDHLGQPCPVVISGVPQNPKKLPESGESGYTGCALTLDSNHARVIFNHSSGKIKMDETIHI